MTTKRKLNAVAMLRRRLAGYSLQAIADEAGVSRTRVHQILTPPVAVKEAVRVKFKDRCAECKTLVGTYGHVHLVGAKGIDTYQDITKLELLCGACHQPKHARKRRKGKTDD